MTIKISIPEPKWNSDLAKSILDLEKLRTQRLYSKEIPSYIFFQLKDIFQMLETLGSARIEGNNTTLAEYVEKIIEENAEVDETNQELDNIENAIDFIEENTSYNTSIDRAYISQLHNIITYNLTPPQKGEGSRYPGQLRPHDVTIKKSGHTPTSCEMLPEAFETFIDFINKDMLEQNQLLMVAVAHHLFMHIHPFDNGNGRMGRLLTYALLIKLGFNVKSGRIINPSSVFYTDRDKYYEMLGLADSLEEDAVLQWCEYFLSGLKNQIEKIDHLLSGKYTREQILIPMIKFALERENITSQEYEILAFIIKSKSISIKSSELGQLGYKTSQQKSNVMRNMRDKKMVVPLTEGGRVYTINFINSYLLRGVIKTLKDKGFIAEFLNNEK